MLLAFCPGSTGYVFSARFLKNVNAVSHITGVTSHQSDVYNLATVADLQDAIRHYNALPNKQECDNLQTQQGVLRERCFTLHWWCVMDEPQVHGVGVRTLDTFG